MTDAERAVGFDEAEANDQEQPVVRDRRRIDPDTGELRGPDRPDGDSSPDAAAADSGEAGDELQKARTEAAERLDDLRRLQAEYVNYRRRVERDRELVRETAKSELLGEFLPVLDDIGRAREHGDLTGAFGSVGEAVEAVAHKAGLERFGEVGDEFDPTVHEALMHGYADDVDVTTCTQIMQPGYRVGERIIRPARVAVSEPTEALPGPADGDDPEAGAAGNGDQDS